MLLAGTHVVLSKSTKSVALDLISPAGCPLSGCAAGQRLNYRLSFPISPVFTGGDNVMVCITSTGGSSTAGLSLVDFSTGYVSTQGLVSGAVYTPIANCAGNAFSGEDQIVSVSAQVNSSLTDQLNLALRLNRLADLDGNLKYHLFEKDAGGTWIEKGSASAPIEVDPAQVTEAYVAENSNACNLEAPCFINSGDDLASGLGTGLKDAVDALPDGTSANPVKITILGTYPIKANEVLLNRPNVFLQGRSGSVLTAQGTICTAPMLGVTSGLTIQNLSINDGECTSVSRNLIRVNSSLPVVLQRNTLQNGAHAIVYEDNTGNLLVQFNQITNNVGNAIRRVGSSSTGSLLAVANNFLGNAWSLQVECGNPAKGTVDHNFWGAGLSPATGSSHCTYTEGSQLGAAILAQSAGVAGELTQVRTVSTSLFNGAVILRHSTGSDYPLYIVNHGQGSSDNIPFLNHGTELSRL